MAVEDLRYEHELDNELADAGMFAWFRPAFRLAVKHWPISIAVGFAALSVGRTTMMSEFGYLSMMLSFTGWVKGMIHLLIEWLAWSLVIVVAYRFLAEKERVGAVNDWRLTLIRTAQITGVWWIATAGVAGVYTLYVRWQFARSINAMSSMNDVGDFVGLVWSHRISGFITLIVTILLIPVVMNVAVAGILSTVYAVRSRVPALDAVRASFRLAFDEKWRTFWPAYAIAVAAIVLQWLFDLVWESGFFTLALWLATLGMFAGTAFTVALTFVIERAYAAHLTLPPGEDEAAPAPSKPPSRRRTRPGQWAEQGRSPTVSATPAASTAPVTPAGPETPPAASHDVAARLVEDLRMNRTQQLVETVERSLAADAKFFAGQPDTTLALAKRLVAMARPDLALRVMQPYLKDQRGHRMHLTGALFVADLLARDPRRLADAARFLAQVKALYPREPMVDQAIKITNKAIAAGSTPLGAT
jgi:hypothetical protein